MSLITRFNDLENKVSLIENELLLIPKWIPLTKLIADELGYKTVDGLRAWCYRNLGPDEFTKDGRLWHIHKSALLKIKTKGV